tara:strand:+ start:155 stop:475 length:321 start_codon:yes stop_codon:yes gene_type:complete
MTYQLYNVYEETEDDYDLQTIFEIVDTYANNDCLDFQEKHNPNKKILKGLSFPDITKKADFWNELLKLSNIEKNNKRHYYCDEKDYIEKTIEKYLDNKDIELLFRD